MLNNFFYLIIFMSVISAMAWLLLLLIQSIGHIRPPYILYVSLMLFLFVPITVGNVKWIDSDPGHKYSPQFELAAKLWAIGVVFFLIVTIIKFFLLRHTLRKLTSCEQSNILAIAQECAKQVGLGRIPPILFGRLAVPACVITCIKPRIVLSEDAIKLWTDDELYLVLLHECTHIKHFHLPLKRLFHLLCCLHWMNPFVWIAKREFSLSCELDCDLRVVKSLPAGAETRYVYMLIRLMELSFRKPQYFPDTAGILTFMDMKQRLSTLLQSVTKPRRNITIILSLLILFITLWSSFTLSTAMFYPYPFYQNNQGDCETK